MSSVALHIVAAPGRLWRVSKQRKLRKVPKVAIILGVVLVILVLALFSLLGGVSGHKQVPVSQVVKVLNSNQKLKSATILEADQLIRIETASGERIEATWIANQDELFAQLLTRKVADGTLPEWRGDKGNDGAITSAFLNVGLMGLMLVIIFIVMGMSQGGGGRIAAFGRSKAKVANKDTPKTTFADVAGADEAVEELQEIKEFLQQPGKFQAVGAKIPKGVLLYGQPGTGKTLLARAVAGEAGVPFFSISGSDFVEMFVGVGASRVRDLFDQAKQNAPAIVFIDEIDAVGRHRGAGMGGGHDEREQTLNQLLVEMDGFDVRGGVILIAATNRPDVLDPALLRPGRFDRQISVDAPDLKGRDQILRVHAKDKPIAQDVDLSSVAKRTPGFTGADLANVLNEAALLTARNNLTQIGAKELDEAIDRVIAGPQKKTRLMDDHERLVTAYHEGGHALVAAAMPNNDPVQKITILPRGRALGYTMVMPDEDKYSQTRGELQDRLAYILGGRAAEELVFHDPTTGASNDIEQATKIARAMVTQYGMSERIGAIRLGSGDSEPFLGMAMGGGGNRDYSENIAAIVDSEVEQLINNAHQEAFDALVENRAVLDELARQLLEHETLDKAAVEKIFEPLKKRAKRPAWTGSETRVPSTLPPIEVPKTTVPATPQPVAGPGFLPPGSFPPPNQPPVDQPPPNTQ